jgi:hypothetical protein
MEKQKIRQTRLTDHGIPEIHVGVTINFKEHQEYRCSACGFVGYSWQALDHFNKSSHRKFTRC